MKVVLVNGSPNKSGSTYAALSEMAKVFESEKIETEIIYLGKEATRDCIGCGVCRKGDNKCVFDDDMVNDMIEKISKADGLVIGSPVYYAHPSGRIISILDRVFYAGGKLFTHKPGMAIVAARRGGTAATFDVLNKYFTIAQMPVVSSTYWNMVYGLNGKEIMEDAEGIQTMKNGANNMIWMMKCIEAGKQAGIEPPVADMTSRTNFVR